MSSCAVPCRRRWLPGQLQDDNTSILILCEQRFTSGDPSFGQRSKHLLHDDAALAWSGVHMCIEQVRSSLTAGHGSVATKKLTAAAAETTRRKLHMQTQC